MDRYDYIESIMIFIKGQTGINFQLQIGEILKKYYKTLGKTYEMPDYYGGDQKNDGWVVEDAIFYQIYAPTRLKTSLRNEMQNKFEEDLTGLLKIVYDEKKWNGTVKEFIFIVNTLDGNLPHDSVRFFPTTVDNFKKKYKIDFKYSVTNSDYIRNILEQIHDIDVLKNISSTLHIKGMIDNNAITETIITNLIIGISGNLSEKFMGVKSNESYDRISSVKKIEINDLGDKKEEIENIISKLDVVEKAVYNINQDILCENKFERVKEFVVKKYSKLSNTYHGVELYEKIISETLAYSNNKWNLDMPMRFLIVFIFDKCDIFEKE